MTRRLLSRASTLLMHASHSLIGVILVRVRALGTPLTGAYFGTRTGRWVKGHGRAVWTAIDASAWLSLFRHCLCVDALVMVCTLMHVVMVCVFLHLSWFVYFCICVFIHFAGSCQHGRKRGGGHASICCARSVFWLHLHTAYSL